jgi:DNA-binding CsgD family transcriptional regulator
MVEFRIEDTLCHVLPEHEAREALSPGRDERCRARVIGKCLIGGNRYLIVCTAEEVEGVGPEAGSSLSLLTRRELQVALMVCEGQVNKQIAYRLQISEWTVSSYLRRIYTKLGVRSRAAMVAKLLSLGHSGAPTPTA